jgi:hypothetical protein
MNKEFDVVLRNVVGYGWLGMVVQDGMEKYRTWGFYADTTKALEVALLWVKHNSDKL